MMNNRLYICISALVGIVTGFFTIHSFLAHSWMSIFLWIGMGLVILYFARSRSNAVWAGAIYGFLTIATWLITGFQGGTSQLSGIGAIIAIAAPIGAISGAIGAFIFNWIFRRSE